MGLCYYVYTPQDAASWLPNPEHVQGATEGSRYPTLPEVKKVLEGLAQYTSEGKQFARSRWAAHVKHTGHGGGTLVHFDAIGYSRKRQHGPLWFEKGDTELIVDILERCTRICGALVLSCDADLGTKPLVVRPGMSVAEILAPWKMPPGMKV